MAATELHPTLQGVEIGAMDVTEIDEVAGVLARAMRNRPILAAALGGSAPRRQKVLTRLFAGAANEFGWDRQTLVARCADGSIVGVCRIAPPGEYRPTRRQLLRMLPTVTRLGPRSLTRLLRWRRAWTRLDPGDRHWHLGPLAVDPHLQGKGIGTRLMHVVCAQLDAAGEVTYLETDQTNAVGFFERFGFAVVRQFEALEVTTWVMRRPAER